MSTTNQPEVLMTVTPVAGVEVKKFMEQEGVDPAVGGLRVSVQPGGCSGFKYGLLIEDQAAEDDIVVDQGEYRVFVDPFSAQYISGVIIDYMSSMQGSGFTFKNPNATGRLRLRQLVLRLTTQRTHDISRSLAPAGTSAPDTRPAIVRRFAGLRVSVHTGHPARAIRTFVVDEHEDIAGWSRSRIATLIREKHAAGDARRARSRHRLDADRRVSRADPHAPRGGIELRERRDVQSRRVLPDGAGQHPLLPPVHVGEPVLARRHPARERAHPARRHPARRGRGRHAGATRRDIEPRAASTSRSSASARRATSASTSRAPARRAAPGSCTSTR